MYKSYLFEKLKKALLNYFPALLWFLAKKSTRKAFRLSISKYAIDIIHFNTNRTIRIGRLNTVYTLDMINAFDYYFNSAVPIQTILKNKNFQMIDFSTPFPGSMWIFGFSDILP